ncbi:hypothetical protein BGY98DRAFT_935986 [Russula aff. rugulosa BPL654]|nr:hypothetical protein BGY98DRAFT_935986 [Russula aff. rugulosa BPL654]
MHEAQHESSWARVGAPREGTGNTRELLTTPKRTAARNDFKFITHTVPSMIYANGLQVADAILNIYAVYPRRFSLTPLLTSTLLGAGHTRGPLAVGEIVELPDGGAPGVVQEGVDAEGVKPKQTWGWGWDSELPLDLKDSWSAVRGSAASHNNPPNNPPKEESDGGNGGGGDHAMESSQGSQRTSAQARSQSIPRPPTS